MWVSLVHRRQQDARRWAPLDEGVAGAASSTPNSAVQRWLLQPALPQRVPPRHLLFQLHQSEQFPRKQMVPAKELAWSVQLPPPLLPPPSLRRLCPQALEALDLLQHRLQEGAMVGALVMAVAGTLRLLWVLGRRERRRIQQRHRSQQSHPPPHHETPTIQQGPLIQQARLIHHAHRQQQHRRQLYRQSQVDVHSNPDGVRCCRMGRTRMTFFCQLP